MQFRRGIVRICQFVLLLVAAYFALGLLIPRSSVLAESEARGQYVQTRIVVRKVSSAPLWAWPLARIVQDSSQHRFEYYRGSSLWSCDSFTGDSYSARSAEVVWDSTGTTATVSLDGSPIFTCHYGHWTEFKSH